MTYPFLTKRGFGLKVYYAVIALRKYSLNPNRSTYEQVTYNPKFDNCFENYDADAVVYSIKAKVFEKFDLDLARGIKLLGGILWEDWRARYWKEYERTAVITILINKI